MDGLIAEHISKTYAGAHGLSFAALRDVSLHLEPGSFTSLVGESGSGKSTPACWSAWSHRIRGRSPWMERTPPAGTPRIGESGVQNSRRSFRTPAGR